MLPVAIYFLFNNYFLHETEFRILLASFFMLFSLLFANWITYIIYLLLVGWQTILVLALAKETILLEKNHEEKDRIKCL